MPAQEQTTTGTVVTSAQTTTAGVVVSRQTTTGTVVVSRSAPLSSQHHPHPPTVSTTDHPALTTFLLALRELDVMGRLTPCQMPGVDHLWTSESHEDRKAAGYRCQPCPLLTECTTYATTTRERWHVWAGADRTTTTRKEKR